MISENITEILTRLLVDISFKQGVSKSSILKKAHVDISKYYPGGSHPSLDSIFRICKLLKICPNTIVLLGRMVQEKRVSYKQALCFLTHWSEYSHLSEVYQFVIIKYIDQMASIEKPTCTAIDTSGEE